MTRCHACRRYVRKHPVEVRVGEPVEVLGAMVVYQTRVYGPTCARKLGLVQRRRRALSEPDRRRQQDPPPPEVLDGQLSLFDLGEDGSDRQPA